MPQPLNTVKTDEETPKARIPPALPQGKQRATQRSGLQNFSHWDRERQIQTFLAWLPKELHDAPGIDWTRIPARNMGYCLRVVRASPDAAMLAVVAAALVGALALSSQVTQLKQVYGVLRSLRATCHLQSLDDLKQEEVWKRWLQCQPKTDGTRQKLTGYSAVATGHFPRYLLRLDLKDRQRMQRYQPPLVPVDLKESYLPSKVLKAESEANRKAKTDILVPLYPVLRQLIRFRKQLVERMVLAIREACRKVKAGEADLPFHFQYMDAIPEVNRDARTVSEVQIQGCKVLMKLVLWDKPTWVTYHHERYSYDNVRLAELGQGAYSLEQNCFFVQFDGKSRDLLWFGDLMEQRLFHRFDKDGLHVAGYQERWSYARQLGFSKGCFCERAGLLSTGDRWFSEVTDRGNELLFEHESLYRGCLFGAALAMLSLSNGSRLSELLQVSWNKERRVSRTDTVVLLDEEGKTRRGGDGKPLTKQVKLHFQYLLPKGSKTEEERQLFPLSKEVLRLLGEIKTLLEETYGTIPVVAPPRSNVKLEDLKPEHYLFQWDASPDGEVGVISSKDVGTLLRFMFHGLDLFTTQGKPIRVSVHILRHVMATHARHYRKVPPEAIAYFFLHHRLRELTGHAPLLSEVFEYYTLMTEEQRFAIISADLDEQEEIDHALLRAAPTPRDLEQMNEDLRAVFEEWHALHPTALGNCGCPGLCPRGNDRALCLGCSYLVTDPEKIGVALAWRTSYEKQVELFKAQGNYIDARQAQMKVQYLDDVIAIMRLQIQAEADGSYIPLHKVLPSPYRKTE